MKRRAQVVERLRNYEIMRFAVKNLQDQIQWLKVQQEGIHAVRTDRVAVRSQPGGNELKLLEAIEQRQKMEIALENTKRWLQITDRALQALSEEERLILQKFYISRATGALEELCQLLGVEKSSVYRKRDKALDKMALALYGIQPEPNG